MSARFPTLTALALTGVLLAGCGDTESGDGSAEDPASTTPAGSESSTATEATDATTGTTDTDETETGSETAEVALFFVGDTSQGPRLFREDNVAPADNLLEEAAAMVTGGEVIDQDYRTAWPAGSFESVTYDGDAFVVTLADDGWLTAPGNAEEAKLAVQQLVYTLQATQGEEAPVEVELDGKPAATLLGVKVGNGLKAAPELETRGLVNVFSPAEGATVTADSFTASGEASSFEATVPWEVRDADGEVVVEGFATAEGWMDRLYPWESKVDISDLGPGEYTFVAMTDDPSGGEGHGPTEDTKSFVIE